MTGVGVQNTSVCQKTCHCDRGWGAEYRCVVRRRVRGWGLGVQFLTRSKS